MKTDKNNMKPLDRQSVYERSPKHCYKERIILSASQISNNERSTRRNFSK